MENLKDLVNEMPNIPKKEVKRLELCALVEIGEREQLMAELQCHHDHLREMVAKQAIELEKSKEMGVRYLTWDEDAADSVHRPELSQSATRQQKIGTK